MEANSRLDNATGSQYKGLPFSCFFANGGRAKEHGFGFTPGRYVGSEASAEDDEPFEEKMTRLVALLAAQQAEAAMLDKAINANFRGLGYGG